MFIDSELTLDCFAQEPGSKPEWWVTVVTGTVALAVTHWHY